MAGGAARLVKYARTHGVAYTACRAAEKLGERLLGTYDRMYRRDRASEAELARQRALQPDAGLISVVVPVYNTNPDFLKALAQSLTAQTYARWEACLYDDVSPRADTRDALQEIAAMDPRFRVMFGRENLGLAGNTNRAAKQTHGEWIVLLDHDDLLEPDALYRVAETAAKEQPEMIYSDEDKVTERGNLHTDLHCKPDFCPDNLRSANYICHLMAIRRTLLDTVGGLRPAFDGSQDHDLALRLSERTSRISHIPAMLYSWRTVGSSVSHQNLARCLDASCRAVMEHMARIGYPGAAEAEAGVLRLRYEVPETMTAAVLILAEDEADGACCLAAFERDAWPCAVCRVIATGANRYAAMNRATAEATEDVLVFVDASVLPEGADFLRELLMYAQRDDVGAVTPVLLDRRRRIAHGGFAVGMAGVARCRGQGLTVASGGRYRMMRLSHNVAAVSAACAAIRRDHFLPFDEKYRGGLGAVDWSLRLLAAGRRNVYTPHAVGQCGHTKLLLLRGADDAEDVARFERAHGQAVYDPCYSARFSRQRGDFRIE